MKPAQTLSEANAIIADLRIEKIQVEQERDTLMTRITELKADADATHERLHQRSEDLTTAQARIKELEAAYEEVCRENRRHLQELSAMTPPQTALTSAPAGRMEYYIGGYQNTAEFDLKQNIMSDKGWTANGDWKLCPDGTIAVMWQRPVASGQAGEGSEAGE